MKTFLAHIQSLELAKIWLFSTAGCLVALQLHLTWQAKLTNLAVTSLLFFLFIFLQFKKKSHPIILESGVLSKIIGIAIIFAILLNSQFLPNYDFAIRLLPLILGLALALIASGIKRLKQYWQELILLVVLAVPLERLIHPINELVSVTTILAQFSTFILWYLGFEASRQGDIIILPMRATWVGPNCAGILTMLWMLQLSVLFLVMFPTKFVQKILVPIGAVIIVITVNGIRIAIMAILAAYNYRSFEYWHSDRPQIFSTIPILLFGFFCQFLLHLNERENKQKKLD